MNSKSSSIYQFLKRYRSYIGILLILVLLILMKPWSTHNSDNAVGGVTRDEAGSAHSEVSVAEGASKAPSLRRPSTMGKRPTHVMKDLVDFYHPRIDLKDHTIDQAMTELLAEYAQICAVTGETPLPIKWEVKGSSNQLREVHLEGSFLGSCRKLAFFSRMSLKLEENTLIFEPVAQGPIKQKALTVPPNFAEVAGSLFQQDEGEARIDLNSILLERGILLPGETLTTNPLTATIEVQGSAGSIQLMSDLIESAREQKPIQIKYSLNHKVDGTWKPLPSVLARSGQQGIIEISSPVAGNGDPDQVRRGTQLTIQGELYGFGERMNLRYSRSGETAREPGAPFESHELSAKNIVTTVEDREKITSLEFTGEDQGERAQFNIHSERIDATGRQITGPIPRKDEPAIRNVRSQTE